MLARRLLAAAIGASLGVGLWTGSASAFTLDDFTVAQVFAAPPAGGLSSPVVVGSMEREIFANGYGFSGGGVEIGGGVATFTPSTEGGLNAEIRYTPISGLFDLTGATISFDVIGETGGGYFDVSLAIYETGTFNSEGETFDSAIAGFAGSTYSFAPTGAGIDLTQIERIVILFNAEPGVTYALGSQAPVPLPAAGLLLAGGLAGLAGAGLRRRG